MALGDSQLATAQVAECSCKRTYYCLWNLFAALIALGTPLQLWGFNIWWHKLVAVESIMFGTLH